MKFIILQYLWVIPGEFNQAWYQGSSDFNHSKFKGNKKKYKILAPNFENWRFYAIFRFAGIFDFEKCEILRPTHRAEKNCNNFQNNPKNY